MIVPTLYLTSDAAAARMRRSSHAGGTLLVTYWSGIVDENDHVRLGGYPGAFRELLGVRAEEFCPLREGERVSLDDGSSADQWTELLHLEGAQAVSSYVDGALAGVPAVTRHDFGQGTAWYVATRLDHDSVARLTSRVVSEAGVEPVVDTVPGVEVVRRPTRPGRPVEEWLILFNPFGTDARVDVTLRTNAAVPEQLAADRRTPPHARARPHPRTDGAHRRRSRSRCDATVGRVVAEQSMIFGPDSGYTGLTSSLGAVAPAPVWTFADGAATPGTRTVDRGGEPGRRRHRGRRDRDAPRRRR